MANTDITPTGEALWRKKSDGTDPTPTPLQQAAGFFQVGGFNRLRTSAFAPGRRVLWLGDSITHGSASTNAAVNSYVAIVPVRCGTALIATTGLRASVEAGVPGDKAEMMLARLPALLNTNAPDILHILAGTNGSVLPADGTTPDFATYKSSMIQMINLGKAKGCVVVVSLVPPGGVATMPKVHQYNQWITQYCRSQGVTVVDTFSPLCNLDGTQNTTYFNADTVHPNDAGHLVMAEAIAAAFKAILPAPLMPPLYPLVGAGGANLLAKPFCLATSDWTNDGGTGSGSTTVSIVDPVNGDGIPAGGKWLQMVLNNSAGGGAVTNTRQQTMSPLPSAGDKLMITYVSDGGMKIDVANGTTAFGVLASSAQGKTGVMCDIVTVPASPTAIKLRAVIGAQAGETITGKIGAVQAWNLTTGNLLEFQ